MSDDISYIFKIKKNMKGPETTVTWSCGDVSVGLTRIFVVIQIYFVLAEERLKCIETKLSSHCRHFPYWSAIDENIVKKDGTSISVQLETRAVHKVAAI